MMRKRIEQMKARFLEVQPRISPERLLLATEAYKKYAGEAVPIFRARVLEYVLDHMKIVIHPGELIVGSASEYLRGGLLFPEYMSTQWLYDELEIMPVRERDKMELSEDDKKIIKECLSDYWVGKSLPEAMEGIFSDDLNFAIAHEIFSVGFMDKSGSEIVPNYEKLLQKGMLGYAQDCRDLIEETGGGTLEKQDKIDFWKACIIVCEAVIRFSDRYADKAEEMAKEEQDDARKQELITIAKNCRNVPAGQPTTFHEAVQAIWFLHLIFHIESPATACSFARYDQTVYPYLQMEMDRGTYEYDDAKEILECFYLKTGELIKVRGKWSANAFAGFPMWPIIMVGGIDANGEDATNELTYMCLDAGDDLRMANPVLSLRVHDGTPDRIMKKACKMVQEGLANPGFFNDEVAMQIVQEKGGSLEEARNWCIVGCIQPHPGGGCSDGHPDGSYINGGKVLELVLHNGIDPATGRKVGVETGDPSTFTCKEDLIDACKEQMRYLYRVAVECVNKVMCYHIRRLPTIYSSLVLDDCIEKGMSVEEGGARHNGTELFLTGPANIVDSIVAIEDIVFNQKLMTLPELIEILDKNFEGNEILRQKILNESKKFGNDEAYVDDLLRDLLAWVADMVQQYKDPRGGHYDFTIMSQTVNVIHGRVVGATPDGRKAGEPLNDNSSPMMGRDVNGPTATINSVAAMGQKNFRDGALFNMRFDPRGISGEKGLNMLDGIIRTYFKAGGHHIQVNVVDDKTLREAQQNPEKHRGLVVRIAGYMAYFTELDPEVQEALIKRTTHLQ